MCVSFSSQHWIRSHNDLASYVSEGVILQVRIPIFFSRSYNMQDRKASVDIIQTHQNTSPYWSIRISIKICVILGYYRTQSEWNHTKNDQHESTENGETTWISPITTSSLSSRAAQWTAHLWAAKITKKSLLVLLRTICRLGVSRQTKSERLTETGTQRCHDGKGARWLGGNRTIIAGNKITTGNGKKLLNAPQRCLGSQWSRL